MKQQHRKKTMPFDHKEPSPKVPETYEAMQQRFADYLAMPDGPLAGTIQTVMNRPASSYLSHPTEQLASVARAIDSQREQAGLAPASYASTQGIAQTRAAQAKY